MTKMTKKDYFNQLLNIEGVKENSALVDFVNHELELLAKKNSADRKPNAKQNENEELKFAILVGMEDGEFYTVTELMKSIPEIAELTNQRVSALVRQLKNENKVTREEINHKAYFKKIED